MGGGGLGLRGEAGPPRPPPGDRKATGALLSGPERGLHLHSSPQALPAQALSRGDT